MSGLSITSRVGFKTTHLPSRPRQTAVIAVQTIDSSRVTATEEDERQLFLINWTSDSVSTPFPSNFFLSHMLLQNLIFLIIPRLPDIPICTFFGDIYKYAHIYTCDAIKQLLEQKSVRPSIEVIPFLVFVWCTSRTKIFHHGSFTNTLGNRLP